jgi:hypothetical protein
MTLLARYSPRLVSLAVDRDNQHRHDNAHCAEPERRPEDALVALAGRQAQVDGDDAAFREVQG